MSDQPGGWDTYGWPDEGGNIADPEDPLTFPDTTYYVQEHDANDRHLGEAVECPTVTEAHGLAALQSIELPGMWVVTCVTDGRSKVIGIFGSCTDSTLHKETHHD